MFGEAWPPMSAPDLAPDDDDDDDDDDDGQFRVLLVLRELRALVNSFLPSCSSLTW